MAGSTAQEGIVQKAVHQWEARLEELRPAVEEASEIEDALKAMGQNSTTRPSRRRNGTRRRRREGGRRAEFLQIIRDNPGITVGDAAKQMKIGPNYLYRVASDLVKDKAVKKVNGGYEVVASGGNGSRKGNGGGSNGE